MNEEAYQDQMDDDAQFEAEQEELREIACAKYEGRLPTASLSGGQLP